MTTTLLELAGLALALAHFSIPLAYYWYTKTRWLRKPWNLELREDYKPKVTVIIPTYNEAEFIARRLDNIYEQDYPRELVEVIVVDGASTDGTPEVVEKWAREHPDVKLKLLREPERRGKGHALNEALKLVEGDIVVIADADALWSKSSLSNAIKLLSDPVVGAVSCLKSPIGSTFLELESSYREYYNTIRLAESKAHSTPVFHGELAAFKRKALEMVGGFPVDLGADDSYTAVAIAIMGYRAVVGDNVECKETVPDGVSYHLWRIRRAQHLIQSFARSLMKVKKAKGDLRIIVGLEAYLHLLNPWLLFASLIILMVATSMGSTISVLLLISGGMLLLLRPFRMWIAMQVYLVLALLRNLYSKELVWDI